MDSVDPGSVGSGSGIWSVNFWDHGSLDSIISLIPLFFIVFAKLPKEISKIAKGNFLRLYYNAVGEIFENYTMKFWKL